MFKIILGVVLSLFVGAQAALAQQDAETQLNDAEATGSYAASDESRSNEDSSDNASAVFDGQPSGSVEDPTTLEPKGMVITPNGE